MSDKKAKQENAPVVAEETTVQRKKTKYDEKMEKRAADKKKAIRDERIFNTVGVLIIIALVALIASFPIRSYMAVHKVIANVGGEEISQIKFDYYYNNFKNTYLASYGQYLSYMGIDSSSDMSTVNYDDYLSFKDYFEEQTIEQLKQTVALKNEAKAAGFTYDTDEDWTEFVESVKTNAEAQGMTIKDFYLASFGSYATQDRVEEIVREAAFVNAYIRQINDGLVPSDAEIDTYYSENTEDYDLVDYRMTAFAATLPTAPTELADEGAAVAEDGTYTPSEAEVSAAMADAKALADEAEKTIATEGELHTGESNSVVTYSIRSWLFEDGRKSGDTTVIEATASNTYYVVEFENRYQDQAPTVDLRAVVVDENKVDEILAEYEAGAKTEESFIELVKTYSIDTYSEDGLFEGQAVDGLGEELTAWLTDSARKAGDVTAIWEEDYQTGYVVYFKANNKPTWYFNIQTTLQNQKLSEYLEAVTADVTVSDPNNNLKYIELRAQQEADQAAALEASENAESTESSETSAQ